MFLFSFGFFVALVPFYTSATSEPLTEPFPSWGKSRFIALLCDNLANSGTTTSLANFREQAVRPPSVRHWRHKWEIKKGTAGLAAHAICLTHFFELCGRQLDEISVARWQNLIPSFPWINVQERDTTFSDTATSRFPIFGVTVAQTVGQVHHA